MNDTYGHEAGDRVLKAISRECTAALRPGDMFARLGGEEFAVLLPATGHAAAVHFAERLRCVVETIRIEHEGQLIHVTASLGSAASEAGKCSLADLLNAADAALYDAKRSGRNRVGMPRSRAVA